MIASRLAAMAACIPLLSQAADPPAGVVGKDGWLFYRYEATEPAHAADTKTSVQLMAKLARVLAKNDVAVLVTLVPVKMRIYAANLPADFPLTPHMKGQYAQFAGMLRAQKVPFADLDAAFMQSAKRESDTPLFMRNDTHWSPMGAFTAAEAIKAAIEADPALDAIVKSIPPATYNLAWDTSKKPTTANDLASQIPAAAAKPETEQVLSFLVNRQKSQAGLLDDSGVPAITLLGSSYSSDWTQFPSALRHALQRDVLSIAVPATQGSWVGMENYLRDDAFQANPPKLIVWEMPERDMVAPPSFKYREVRYRIDNTDWLLRAAAWATRKCEPGRASVKATSGKLSAAGPSAPGDFVEVSFTPPLERTEYVSARLTTYGSSHVKVDSSGAGAPARSVEVLVAGDDEGHVFKTPLAKGHDKLRITPGKTHAFKLEDVKVCRQVEGLLD
jgi:alginate O-acetyltransferase complex protein AlgJ